MMSSLPSSHHAHCTKDHHTPEDCVVSLHGAEPIPGMNIECEGWEYIDLRLTGGGME